MFCSTCGLSCPDSAAFCHKCGSKLTTESISSSPVAPSNFGKAQEFVLPTLGEVKTSWKQIKVFPRFKCKLPTGWDWIANSVDVVFTDTHVILIAAPDKGKLAKLASGVGSRAFAVGYVFGLAGLVIALPAAILASTYEKLYEKNNILNQESIRNLFEQGLVAIAEKEKLRGTLFVNSYYFGMSKSYNARFSGEFFTNSQSEDMRIYFDDESTFDGGWPIKSGLEMAGFKLNSFDNITDVGVENILKFHQEYPEKLGNS
ncbi:MAG: zinc ribbon domain-containing protein [Sulfuricella sp.]